MAIQYRMSDPTNFRNSRFRNVEAREENAVSCEGTVSTYSFSRIDQTGTCGSGNILAVPACYSVFTAVQGTYINCCFPRFDWDNEMVVVKQSISVILSGVIGMICIAVPVLLHWFLGLPNVGVLWGMAAILIVLSVILYFKACGKKII